MAATDQRQLAHRLSGTAPDEALEVARSIKDAWFRCQALSQVARYWPIDDYRGLLNEALAAANSHDDVFKQVTVSAWPIRGYLERGSPASAKTIVERCVGAASSIENMGSRSEALFMVFQAAKPGPTDLWKLAFSALLKATEPALAWRQRRNIRDAVSMVAADDPQLVQTAPVSSPMERLSPPSSVTSRIAGAQSRGHSSGSDVRCGSEVDAQPNSVLGENGASSRCNYN